MFRDLAGRTVFVNTSTGEAFRGSVASVNKDFVRLAGVTVVNPDGSSGEADGFVRVPIVLVTWIQEL